MERLQFMLNFVNGIDDLDVDGIFGPKTEAAVRDFQQNENLSVDGIVGKQTWTGLLRRWLLFSQPGWTTPQTLASREADEAGAFMRGVGLSGVSNLAGAVVLVFLPSVSFGWILARGEDGSASPAPTQPTSVTPVRG